MGTGKTEAKPIMSIKAINLNSFFAFIVIINRCSLKGRHSEQSEGIFKIQAVAQKITSN